MSIRAIRSTNVHVSDQDKAVDFYVNKLGFEKRADQPFPGEPYRWIEVAPPGAGTALILVHGYAAYNPALVGTFTGIVFSTDDCQKTFEELTARGVQFTLAPEAQPWGVQAIFLDQDGNSFVLRGPIPGQPS